MKALIIIPAYNEEKNLPKLLANIKECCADCDILVINDCSIDGTSEIAKAAHVNVIDLPVNLGIGGAVQTGYKYAYYYKYDAAIQVDGDGQHDPVYIRDLLKELERGSNLCIGSRFINKEGFQSTFSRRFGIQFFSKLLHFLTSQLITDPTSGFRACDGKVIKMFAHDYPKDFPEPETIVFVKKKNYKISEIPVIMNKRDEGQSSITKLKSFYYMVKVSFAIIIASLYSNTLHREADDG